MSRNFVKKNEMLQRVVCHFREQYGKDVPIELPVVAEWALKKGLVPTPRPKTPRELVARDLGAALRAEYRRDAAGGFYYRANLAFRTKNNGQQMTLWVDMDVASSSQVQLALNQRREQLVGDAVGISNDAEHFNTSRGATEGKINMVFDFTDDIEERKLTRHLEQSEPSQSPDFDEYEDEGEE